MPQMNPNITMNGSRGSLVMQRMAVVHALTDVIGAMRDMAPHGRDYQGLPPAESEARYRADRSIWEARLLEVVRLQQEVEKEAIAIHNEQY